MSTKDNNEDTTFNKIYIFFKKIDTSLDFGLGKLHYILEKVLTLFYGLFNFMKKSLERKQLKKVYFILIMSVVMAFVFFGVNVFFGKVIL
jgi:hypothetical protein